MDPVDVQFPQCRTWLVDVEDLGRVEVREPTLAEVIAEKTNVYWWRECVRWPGAGVVCGKNADCARLPARVASFLIEEVCRACPTPPPKGGSGESQEAPKE